MNYCGVLIGCVWKRKSRDLCVLHRELCVVFCTKCFMKLKTESKSENQCLVL